MHYSLHYNGIHIYNAILQLTYMLHTHIYTLANALEMNYVGCAESVSISNK